MSFVAGTGTLGEFAVPASANVNCCCPALQFSVPENAPPFGLLKLTVVDAEPPAGTLIVSGLAENGEAGATHVTTAGAAPGFWKLIGAFVGAVPTTCGGVVTVLPDTGVEVSGTAVPAGQVRSNVRATGVPPWFSLHVSVCTTCVAPRVQVPLSGPPAVDAAAPTAVTVWPKPTNGAVGAVQVVVVVADAPVPTPAVPIAAEIEALPVEPIVVPPVNETAPPAAGV